METHVFPLPGTILCCSSIRQNIKLDQERGGLNPSLLACCSQAKQLSLQFLQHLHFKQHYPCSATYPCPGKCPALKPECIKASEGQSSISSTVPTLCWFGIRLKKSELCSFEPPQTIYLFQHLQVFALPYQFDCDTPAKPCWSGTGYNECSPKVQRWFHGGHLWS